MNTMNTEQIYELGNLRLLRELPTVQQSEVRGQKSEVCQPAGVCHKCWDRGRRPVYNYASAACEIVGWESCDCLGKSEARPTSDLRHPTSAPPPAPLKLSTEDILDELDDELNVVSKITAVPCSILEIAERTGINLADLDIPVRRLVKVGIINLPTGDGGRNLYSKMKTLLLTGLLCGALSASAAVPHAFYRAVWQVESSGRQGAILGDNGRSLGPYQIGKAYWQDAGVPGTYGMVTNEAYARRVVASYLSRYAPAAVATGDVETLARIHNGGPTGASKAATMPYWRKVKAEIEKAESRKQK